MRVYMYVEGEADARALRALLSGYIAACAARGWGLQPIDMKSKSQLLAKIGSHAKQRLMAEPDSHVVAMPDVHPTEGFGTKYTHDSYESLCARLRRLVGDELADVPDSMARFHAFPFRHDMESLLLASPTQLAAYLRTQDNLSTICRHPVEDQDNRRPPKRIVEQTFLTKHYRKIAYQDVRHAPAILRSVDLGSLSEGELPRFWEFLRVLEVVTGVPLR